VDAGDRLLLPPYTVTLPSLWTTNFLTERAGPQYEQLLVLLQPKERAAIITQFQKKSAETRHAAEEEHHAEVEGDTDQKKKDLLATATGLVTHVGVGKGDGLTEWVEEDADDAHGEQDQEEKTKRKDNQTLANFFRPVQRQITDIITDVSLTTHFHFEALSWCYQTQSASPKRPLRFKLFIFKRVCIIPIAVGQ
jgi:hypothetical protein